MPIEVKMPKPGSGSDELVLGGWYVQDNETVTEGQMIFHAISEKADIDVEAPVSGTLEHRAEVGERYEAGQTVAVIK